MAIADEFLAGVIEGFYGKPWSQEERLQLFDWMKAWGLNTYFYAPKDDLKHRALWRALYDETETRALRETIDACSNRGIRFIYGIAPGLDIRYSDDSEIARLKGRVDQMVSLGCRYFAILFDDIPDNLSVADAERFRSFAKAQCHVVNMLLHFIPNDVRLLFCPTAYCARMARANLGGEGYLSKIGESLAPSIEILWTGPEIISEKITVGDIRDVKHVLGRRPIIWDNLFANDYDGRRFYCGPYSGRPQVLRSVVHGILLNPNNEFPLNYVPLRTFSRFLTVEQYNPREEYLAAMGEWRKEFETIWGWIPVEALVSFGDCFYLPHEDGATAEALFGQIKGALRSEHMPEIGLLKELCARMAELKNRPLFYALSRRIWDLREELDLLEKFLRSSRKDFHSDYHLPNTFRGGFVARLQTLLKQKADGSFEA